MAAKKKSRGAVTKSAVAVIRSGSDARVAKGLRAGSAPRTMILSRPLSKRVVAKLLKTQRQAQQYETAANIYFGGARD